MKVSRVLIVLLAICTLSQGISAISNNELSPAINPQPTDAHLKFDLNALNNRIHTGSKIANEANSNQKEEANKYSVKSKIFNALANLLALKKSKPKGVQISESTSATVSFDL